MLLWERFSQFAIGLTYLLAAVQLYGCLFQSRRPTSLLWRARGLLGLSHITGEPTISQKTWPPHNVWLAFRLKMFAKIIDGLIGFTTFILCVSLTFCLLRNRPTATSQLSSIDRKGKCVYYTRWVVSYNFSTFASCKRRNCSVSRWSLFVISVHNSKSNFVSRCLEIVPFDFQYSCTVHIWDFMHD